MKYSTGFGIKQHIRVAVAGEHEMQRVEAQIAVSVSDLKKSPTAIMAKADGEAVAVLNHNRVMAYMVPADAYEAMVEQLDDLALAKIARARANEVPVRVSLDDL
jgi:antitoxin StbD